MEKLIIPSNVKTIESCAFFDCIKLKTIVFSEGLTLIGGEAFEGCTSLTQIVIPNTVRTISYRAFAYCSNLVTAVIPHSVVNIGSNSFEYSNLNNLIIFGCPDTKAASFAATNNITFMELVCRKHLFVQGECTCCHKLLGDINGDGIRNNADLDLLTSYVNGSATCPDLEIADMDRNGSLTSNDEYLLMRLILGYNIWS